MFLNSHPYRRLTRLPLKPGQVRGPLRSGGDLALKDRELFQNHYGVKAASELTLKFCQGAHRENGAALANIRSSVL